ncbi:MAG: hypothetical protein H6529_17325 [Nocardioides sp.]|nr:hypothetical protein [Nocardioidaceae bacterium]MCB8958226.1 hypothetical protein [Nocardioides sp.]
MPDRPRRLRRLGAPNLRGLAGRDQGLKARVEALEEEMQESRRLNRRLAELMDVVEELLVPLSQRDQDRVDAYLASNTTRLASEAGDGRPAASGPTTTEAHESQRPGPG